MKPQFSASLHVLGWKLMFEFISLENVSNDDIQDSNPNIYWVTPKMSHRSDLKSH